jgi:hypothetical protein
MPGVPAPSATLAASLLQSEQRPGALRLGLTTERDSQAFLAEIAATASDRSRFGLWPLISAWKRLPGERP